MRNKKDYLFTVNGKDCPICGIRAFSHCHKKRGEPKGFTIPEPMNTKGKSFFDLSTKEKKRIVHDAAVASNEAQKELMNTKGKKIFEYEYYKTQNEVRAHIQSCEGRHTQQVAYSTFHDSLTQI